MHALSETHYTMLVGANACIPSNSNTATVAVIALSFHKYFEFNPKDSGLQAVAHVIRIHFLGR